MTGRGAERYAGVCLAISSYGSKTNRMRILITLLLLTGASVAIAADNRVVAELPSDGIEEVILRAGLASSATVRNASGTRMAIVIEAIAAGDAKGYQPSDPNWKEIPANKWGLSFVSQRFGKTLVVSTVNETQYIHHRYVLDAIVVTVPENVTVRLAPRKLTGDGKADLSKP